MRHPASLDNTTSTMRQSNWECTVACSACNTTVNTLLRTPHGMLCPSCYRLVNPPKAAKQVLALVS